MRNDASSPTVRLRRCLLMACALLMLAGVVAGAPGAAAAQDEGAAVRPGGDTLPEVSQIMDYLNDLYRADSAHSVMSMEVVTSNWSRTLELESWSRGADEAVVVIRAPAREAGTATLKTAEGLWNYAPRADRLMRVPSGMMSEGWMGSHFTNEDLMRESSYVDDYDTTLAWGQEGDERTIVATSIPRPSAAVVYSRVVYVMRAADWTPLRTEFYDGDELTRTFTYSDVRQIDGRPIPMRLAIVPHYAPGESTTVTYSTLELGAPVDETLFSQRGLRRVAQGQ
ncbi:MAG: outer membrane lipoprotein-sorting protein [Myxococcales bacterium]|nr:outer membrane lipoprotein-sorting protein [Myxococcales bacterium]